MAVVARNASAGVHRDRLNITSAMLAIMAMLAIVVAKAIKAAMSAARYRYRELRMKP